MGLSIIFWVAILFVFVKNIKQVAESEYLSSFWNKAKNAESSEEHAASGESFNTNCNIDGSINTDSTVKVSDA